MTVSPLLAWRMPGCSEHCRRIKAVEVGRREGHIIEIHDADGHERYGAAHPTPDESTVTVGDIAFDFAGMEAWVAGERAYLSATEARILAMLARRAGRLVDRDDILTEVWGAAYRGEHHLLNVSLARLRQALGPAGRQIHTHPGLGLVLRPDPQPARTVAGDGVRRRYEARLLAALTENAGRPMPVELLAMATHGRSTPTTREYASRACRRLALAGAPITFRGGRGAWARLDPPTASEEAR